MDRATKPTMPDRAKMWPTTTLGKITISVALMLVLTALGALTWGYNNLDYINILDMGSDEKAVQAQAAIGQVVGSFVGILAMLVIAAYSEFARSKERNEEHTAKTTERLRKLRVYQKYMISGLQNLSSEANKLSASYYNLTIAELTDQQVHDIYFDNILSCPKPVEDTDQYHQLLEATTEKMLEVIADIQQYQSLHGRLHASDPSDRRSELERSYLSLYSILDKIACEATDVSNSIIHEIEQSGRQW